MERDLGEYEYEFLKVLPKNKTYLRFYKIRKRTKKLSEDTFYKVAQTLYMIQYVNGNLKGVGLRITDDGLLAVKRYNKKNSWESRNPFWDRVRTGAITFAFTILSGILLYIATAGRKNQAKAQEDKRIESLYDSISRIQTHIGDSSLHR